MHAGLAPAVIEVAGVYPDLVLVAVVLVTTSLRLRTQGLIWAFVAGLTANLLSPPRSDAFRWPCCW